jgi:hypothetical protein
MHNDRKLLGEGPHDAGDFQSQPHLGGASAATTVAVGIRLPAGALETITVDQFRALSATLTGASVTELDATTVGKLLDGFISMGRGPDLALLAADPGVSGGTLADDVVAAWHSGVYDTSAGLASFGLTNIATSPKAPDTSLARLEWAAIRQARWSTATSAATTIRISSSSARPSSLCDGQSHTDPLPR